MLTRRDLLRASASVPAAALPLALLATDDARAQAIDLLKIFVPAAPGGGWDQTARTIEQVLRATGAVKGVQITNVGGAGGAVGLPQFLNQWRGQGNALMVAGMVMVGAHRQQEPGQARAGDADCAPHRRVPGSGRAGAVAVQEREGFCRRAEGRPHQGAGRRRLGRRLRPHPHRHDRPGARRPPTKVSYVAFAGGGPATAALLGNQVAAGISGYGEFSEQIKAGKLRLIAMSADKRQEGIDAPTLKEEGIDVELFNWRGVFAPPGVNDTQRKAMIALMEKMTATPQWAEACKTRDWTPIALVGDEYKTFLDAETARIEGMLKELGLA